MRKQKLIGQYIFPLKSVCLEPSLARLWLWTFTPIISLIRVWRKWVFCQSKNL